MRSAWTVGSDEQGLRLDQFLVRRISGLGRRGTRRSREHVLVLVDGRRQRPGYRVQGGQRVTWEPLENHRLESQGGTSKTAEVTVAAQNDRFAALVKPAGIHSEAIANHRGGASMEAALPMLFPRHQAVLVNRLDRPVSGLVLAALNQGAVHDYKAWQDQGLVVKSYLAVVGGGVEREMDIRAALDTAKRRKVRVMSQEEPDALRWTRVFPASCREKSDESLVRAEIRKGRRHQIRAHLAAAGHPVKLDPLYGAGPDLGWIYLHHCQVVMPGFAACNYPDWADSPDALQVQAL